MAHPFKSMLQALSVGMIIVAVGALAIQPDNLQRDQPIETTHLAAWQMIAIGE